MLLTALIFVHLGGLCPPCTFTSIRQARYLNPNTEIYLIASQSPAEEFLSQEQVTFVDPAYIPETPEHKLFKEIIEIDQKWPDAFLFYTLERFFYLFDFLQERGLKNVIHLENDTMLYVDLDEILPFFEAAEIQFAAPFLSQAAAVPCFVFIKDRISLSPFIQYTLQYAKKYKGPKPYVGVSDMITLALFYQDKENLTCLPTLMPEYSRYHFKLKSRLNVDNFTTLPWLAKNASLFPQFLFDAATLGVFMNGNDRKILPNSKAGTIHFRSLFNPRHFSFFWGKDFKNRDVPYLSFQGQNYRIVNMHFHSKMAEGYTSYGHKDFSSCGAVLHRD